MYTKSFNAKRVILEVAQPTRVAHGGSGGGDGNRTLQGELHPPSKTAAQLNLQDIQSGLG